MVAQTGQSRLAKTLIPGGMDRGAPITKGCKPPVEMVDRLPRIHAVRKCNDR